MPQTFLTAQWRKLALANYAVPPHVLNGLVPYGTELDLWNDTCYVSLVGFMFVDTRLKGWAVPWHRNFEEVNLRFYVRQKHTDGHWRRGVVFVKEIVPKPMLTLVANVVYGEPYVTMPMAHTCTRWGSELRVAYRWKAKRWNEFSVAADAIAAHIGAGSEEEFITEHYYGYTRRAPLRTSVYEVQHPRWQVYPVREYAVDVDFESIYGKPFAALETEMPRSVFLAEGSEVIVKGGAALV